MIRTMPVSQMLLVWTDADCSNKELQAALSYWRKYHSIGSRRRVIAAIKYFRRYH